ncbi:hypothetical protein ACVCAH_32460 [Micromonospora sp. LZ34]
MVAVSESTRVTTAAQLMEAIQQRIPTIQVDGQVRGMPMITLSPGVRLCGGTLEFGGKGVRLTRDNVLEDVTIRVPEHEAAIVNDTSIADLGTVRLAGVRTSGQVLLVARDAVRSGHIHVDGLAVEAADVRGRVDRPHGFGVDALQGGFTLWNQQPDPAAEITAELLDLTIGRAQHPVRGSGVFVGGHGDWTGASDGGTVRVTTLRTGEIHVDGGIPDDTPDLISGGVFVISGAVVEHVLNAGAVTTYGPNDMVLDNWGSVRHWEAVAPITSYGPSGIGFVNFADLDRLDVRAPVVTHGTGARGFNLYAGSLRHASFDSIATTGNGAIGIQVSRQLPVLEVRGDLTTGGGTGTSLVQGVQTQLTAIALSIKSGGSIGQATVGGRIATRGDNLVTVDVDGELGRLIAAGGIHADGSGSDAVRIQGQGPDLNGVNITAADGRTVVRQPRR